MHDGLGSRAGAKTNDPGSFSDNKVAVFVEYLPALQVSGDYAYVRYTRADELTLVDGLLELNVSEGEELGAHGVARLFQSNAELACDAAASEIFRRVGVAQQSNPHDDVLVMVCEMRG